MTETNRKKKLETGTEPELKKLFQSLVHRFKRRSKIRLLKKFFEHLYFYITQQFSLPVHLSQNLFKIFLLTLLICVFTQKT